MTDPREIESCLSNIINWLKEKEYLAGHRTNTLFQNAVAIMTCLRADNIEAANLLQAAKQAIQSGDSLKTSSIVRQIDNFMSTKNPPPKS